MTYYNLVYSQGRGVQIMNKRSILIICLILCVICSISVAAAADVDANATQQDFVQTTEVNDVSVNDTLASSNNPDKLNAEPDSFTQLQNDISGGGDVTLDQDYSYNSGDSGLEEGIVISRSVTITGNGHVIDAKNHARIFNIASGCTVTLNGITFINGNANGDGGAIYSAGTLIMNNCKFENNTATNGGAVYFASVPGKLSDLEFTRNHADNNGGAIYYHADASGTSHDDELKLSNFTDNTAGNEGGALYLWGSTGKMSTNQFIGNNATNDGGAIMIEGANWTVSGSTFTRNTAVNKRGGAIYLEDSHYSYIEDCRFDDNVAGTNGGAIDWHNGADHGNIVNSNFTHNTAKRSGGAVYWFGTNGTINDSLFNDNHALGQALANDSYGNETYGGYGGAIMWTGKIGDIYNSKFTNNEAHYNDATNSGGRGGAIYLQGSTEGDCSDTTFDKCTFIGNIAGTNGGAIDWHEGAHDGLINNSVFEDNKASANGGAVYWRGHNGDIYNSNFTNNIALGVRTGTYNNSGDGGAVSWAGIDGIVVNCRFIDNKAIRNNNLNKTGRGGAVFIGSCDHGNNNTRFSDCYFSNNVAGTNGGAIDWNAGAHNGLVDNCTFIKNTANRSAGAIYWFGINGTINDSTFTDNDALGIAEALDSYGNLTYGGYGGAVMWTGAIGDIYNSTFINNEAHYNGAANSGGRGGAIYLQGSTEGDCYDTTFDKCKFIGNIAGTNGGAIDWHEGAHDGLINNSVFEDNKASANGGAVYWRGHNGDIYNSNFTSNSALGVRKGTYNNTGDGGAIFWAGINGIVVNCRFVDNQAIRNPDSNITGRGGAVYLGAGTNGGAIDWHEGANDGLVDNCTFISNNANRSAGAVFWNGHNGTIKYSKFYNNHALGIALASTVHGETTGEVTYGGDGGAVMWSGSEGDVEYCNFVNNTAAKRGGAVFLQGSDIEKKCENTTFRHSYFANNIAGSNGGAIDWNNEAINGLVDNVTFVNNTAGRSGGALFWNGENGTVKNSKFTNNRATGTFTLDQNVDLGYTFNLVYENIVKINGNTLPATLEANKLYVLNYTSGQNMLKFESWVCDKDHNKIQLGETIVREDDKISPVDWGLDEFFGGDGGTILWSGDIGLVDNCTFIDSNSARRGGGAYMTGSDYVTYNNCTFINCTSGTNGGGLDWLAGANWGKITNCVFNHTRAARSAGAIYYDGDYGRMENITIIGTKSWGGSLEHSDDALVNYAGWDSSHWDTNTTGGDAGAIMFTGDHEHVYNVTFINCIATGRGGAVFLQDNTNVTFDKCKFINNTALGIANNTYYDDLNTSSGLNHLYSGRGGAIAFDFNASNGTIMNSQFANNLAYRDGGALSFAEGASYGNIINSTFENNTAKRSGGAMFWYGYDGKVKNSKFINNRATGEALQYDMVLTYENIIIVNEDDIKKYKQTPEDADKNKLFVLNYTVDANTRMFKSYVNDDGKWLQLDEELITSDVISPKDWGTDQFFGGDGGTILWSGDVGHIDNCTFIESNSARRGGGAYMTGSDYVTYDHCTFINCTSGTNGGGVDWLAGANYGKIYNCVFNATRAARSAGAIYYDGWYGEMINVTIFDTKSWGGSLKTSRDGRVNYAGWDSSHWDTNTTGGDAGAIMFTGNHEYLYNITFTNCTATGRGGAVFLQDNKNVTFEACEFIANTALGTANNTWNDDKNPQGDVNKFFTGNGGAIGFDYGATLGVIKNSKFINNTAVRIGGAISFAKGSSNASIENSEFTNNVAYRSGGAISWDGENGTMKYCNFTNNRALGTDIDRNLFDLTSLSKIKAVSLESEVVSENYLYVLVENNGTHNVSYTMYVYKNGAPIKLEYTTETGPSPTDWATDEYFGGDGGTIFWRGDKGTVDNCRFIDSNSARRGGGAYMTGSDHITFQNSYFENCTSGTNGGGLDWLAGANYGKVINCTFNNTRAARSAGAIYYDGDYGEMRNILIINTRSYGGTLTSTVPGLTYAGWDASHWDTNTTGGDAGAIMYTGDHEYIYNITFINTTAQGRGGAVFLQDNKNITFEACKFIGCEALGIATNTWKDYTKERNDKNKDTQLNYTYTGHGGAIAFDVNAHDATIKDSEFANNYARRDGGAINLAKGSYNATFENCKFENNSAGDDGGAINWEGNVGNVKNITCYNNTGKSYNDPETGVSTSNGGTICLTGNNVTISDSSFTLSTVLTGASTTKKPEGGAIFITGNYSKVINSEFDTCWGPDNAGAIYVIGNHTTIIGSSFENCNATEDGGALYVEGLDCKVYNSTFTDTFAGDDGGAINWVGSNGYIYNITCNNNRAIGLADSHSVGGAVSLAGDDITLTNSSFTDSYAEIAGGAVYIRGVNDVVSNSSFTGCAVSLTNGYSVADYSNGGGAIFISGNNADVDNCNFTDSEGRIGGTIYIKGTDATVDGAIINNSYAPVSAGAIYIEGIRASVKNSDIIGPVKFIYFPFHHIGPVKRQVG